MSRNFLPPPSPGTSYPVQPASGRFHDADATLLSHVGANMAVAEAQTEGRVPSPLSRAYMFFTALFGRSLAMTGNAPPAVGPDGRPLDGLGGAGRIALQQDARETFRGLCAVFALREALGLDLTLESVMLVPDDDRFARLLLPTLGSAPGSADFWRPMRLFTARPAGDERASAEVLAGLSPLTGLFPAANAPRRALASVYWYEPPPEQDDDKVWRDADGNERPPAAVWRDPTGPSPAGADVPLAAQTRAVVRGALARWLGAVIPACTDAALAAAGIPQRSAQLLRSEFQTWASELGTDTAPSPTVRVEPVATEGLALPPFPSLVCRNVGGGIASDFPVHNGRVFVNRSALLSPQQRIWGRRYGHRDLEPAVNTLPARGDNLGQALGLGPRAMPVAFVYVDKLFTPRLSILAQGGTVLSPEWRAMPVANSGATEYALFPFEKEILEVLTPDEVAARTSARFTQEGLSYLVELKLGDQTIRQQYTVQGEDGYRFDIDLLLLDLRLFPKVDLHAPTVQRLLPAGPDGSHPDATYYARVRRGPNWTFGIRPFRIATAATAAAPVGGDGAMADPAAPPAAAPAGAASASREVVLFPTPSRDPRRLNDTRGIGEASTSEPHAPGVVDVYTMDRTPDGFWLDERGMCFVRLPPPPNAGGNPATWELAIDFGTSNTCVAYRVADGSESKPQTLDLPGLTTSLLRAPQYGAIEAVNEGVSAALDFFYLYKDPVESEWLLAPGPKEAQPTYFPTQVVTTQVALKDDAAAPFDLSDGLILFRNINLSGLELLRLVEGFNTEDFDRREKVRPLAKRFRLEQDIKWTRQEWLRSFMNHLRRQVVLAAVQGNATISKITFSYPKAFTGAQRGRFTAVLKKVWGDALVAPIVSESEAVRSLLGADAHQSIVFDIGGGTTDVIGFVARQPTFQTSFKLAAGVVGDYVLASQRVRELLLNAVSTGGVLGGADPLSGTANLFLGGPAPQILNAWTGLLQAVEQVDPSGGKVADLLAYLIPDGASAEDRRAVKGLLLSTALLFGGTAFFAGRLLRAASDGAFGSPSHLSTVHLTLTGNGSKLYRLLNPEPGAFDGVMETLFRRGLGEGHERTPVAFDGIYTTKDGRVAPKTTVALGMLMNPGGAAADIPVANVVGEAFDGQQPLDKLGAFYQALAQRGPTFAMPTAAPPETAAFLDAFEEVFPRGYVRDIAVVPDLGAGWGATMKDATYRAASETIRNRIWHNASEAAQSTDGPDGGGYETAFEPVFIAQLAGLLDQVRKECA